MPKARFYASEEDSIWTVYEGNAPIGRALSKKDAESFVETFNGVLGDHLRDRLLTAVNDAIEEIFE